MTKDEILAMEERQLDGWLSEHLFDEPVVHWDWPCEWQYESGFTALHFLNADEWMKHQNPMPYVGELTEDHAPGPVVVSEPGCWPPEPGEDGCYYASVEPVPFYSTTWEGMGMVIEAMQKREYEFEFQGFYYDDGGGERFFIDATFVQVGWCHTMRADTMPLAVARAAVKALMELPTDD